MYPSDLTPGWQQQNIREPKKWLYDGTTLVLVAFSVAFFSRIFCSVTRAPAALNHAHFVVVPVVAAIILTTAKPKNRQQLRITQTFLAGLMILFTVTVASALLNNAGIVNALLSFLMLGNPFLLLASIVFLPMSARSFARFRKWIIRSSFANMALAFCQWPLLKAGVIAADGLNEGDGMGGVFFVSGAGNYVSATVSIYFGIYYLLFAKAAPLWLRISILGAALFQVQLSDSKQVLVALFGGGILLAFTTMKDISKALMYAIGIILIMAVFYWCIYNIDGLYAFRVYLDKDNVWGLDGEAAYIKPAAFRIIPTYFHSFLNWLVGLGPGHTVGRLGGWLLEENWEIFGALGATRHPASEAVLAAYFGNWLALESTIFCPLFGWAGIWGDLGLLGLGAYLFLGYIVWQCICRDNLSRLMMLSVLVFGFIFTQIEEPGFMLYTAALIGLCWREQRMETPQSWSSTVLYYHTP
ncbi:hypothetical protein [Acaryochloris sp. IP29b_bin.148]|uniref:hypothetical protein n=1 Tax=Acaryochloris sp. IP29b_bin.148 TaxID=2969218 RepID=UPI002618A750|nr:hypothetical protein [Acaryochloris sp. IP29b_bin.148]